MTLQEQILEKVKNKIPLTPEEIRLSQKTIYTKEQPSEKEFEEAVKKAQETGEEIIFQEVDNLGAQFGMNFKQDGWG